MHVERRAHRAFTVVVMRDRGPKSRQGAVARVVDYVATVVGDYAIRDIIKVTQQLLHPFGVQAPTQGGEAGDVRNQDCGLAPLAVRCTEPYIGRWSINRLGSGTKSWRLCAIQIGDGLEQLLAMTQRDTQSLEIAFGEQPQDFEVNVVLDEDLRIPRQSKPVEPLLNGLHFPSPFSIRAVPAGRIKSAHRRGA